MNIRSASIVFALSVVTLGSVVFSQSAHIVPMMGKQPILAQAATYQKLTSNTDKRFGTKVNFEFTNATVVDILREFSTDTLKFEVCEELAGEMISVQFKAVPLGQALDHVASLVGGAWQRSGNTYTLKTKSDLAQTLRPGGKLGTTQNLSALPTLPALPLVLDGMPAEIEIRQDGSKRKFVLKPIEDTADPLDRIELEVEGDKVVKGFRYDAKTKQLKPLSDQELKQYHQRGQELSKDWEKWGQEYGKQWEKWGQEYGKQWEKWGEQFGKDWETWAKKFEESGKTWEKRIDQLEKEGKLKNSWKDMSPEEKAQFEKEMENFRKEFEQGMKDMPKMHHFKMEDLPMGQFKFVMPEGGFEFKAPENLSKEEREAWEKEMKAWRKELEKSMKDLHEHGKMHMFIAPQEMGKAFKFVAPDNMSKEEKEAWEKEMKAWRESFEKAHKEFEKQGKVRVAPMPPMTPDSGSAPKAPRAPMILDFDKLYNTLSDAQLKKMSEQGHLFWSDLTPAQKELLGSEMKGNFTISMSKDGKSITIKGDPQ